MNLLERIFEARQKKKTGFVLALGGGGGRGLAHLGVLDILEQHKLTPDAIVGSSIGALFGSMYAMNPDAKAVIHHACSILQSDKFSKLGLPAIEGAGAQDQSWLARLSSAARQTLMYTKAATELALADTDALVDIVFAFCGGESFHDVKIPLYVTAVEFPGGDCNLFSANSDVKLPCAVAASMAIPGVFEPLMIGGKKYVDGGVASDLPAKEAQMVANSDQLVLAVNVGARPREDMEPVNVFGMRDWAAQIQALYLRKYNKTFSDVLIEPLVGFTQWQDFSNVEQEIEKGRQAALEKMPELIHQLKR